MPILRSFPESVAKKDPRSCVRNARAGKKIPGAVLLSHSQIYSTIAAGALNCRVREGNVCFCSAISTGKKSNCNQSVSTGEIRDRGLTTLL